MLSFNATFIAVFLSFLLFMVLMKALFFDPVARIKAERDQKRKGDLDAFETAIQSHKALLTDYETKWATAQKEAQLAIAQARTAAKQQASTSILQAKADANHKIESALADLQNQQQQILNTLLAEREQFVHLITEKLLHQRHQLV